MSLSRLETLLAAIANGETVDIEPQSRNEKYLLAVLKGEIVDLEPKSRTEAYLKAICEKGLGGGSGGGSSSGSDEPITDSVEYYHATRNPNYPYIPLPSEMTEEEDVIYLLYRADGSECGAGVYTRMTGKATIEKYMNTKLVSSITTDENISSNKTFTFTENDEDWNDYNYVVVKLQGTFTNNTYFYGGTTNKLIEVSGKCANYTPYMSVSDLNGGSSKYGGLEYFSSSGPFIASAKYKFSGCYSLKCLPEINFSNVTNADHMFSGCKSLGVVSNMDFSKLTSINSLFYDCSNLRVVSNINFSGVSSVQTLFNNGTSYPIPIEIVDNLDLRSMTNVSSLFKSSTNLKKVSNINVSSATDINSLFESCKALETVENLIVGDTFTAQSVFLHCHRLKDISKIKSILSKATTVSQIFSNCYSLENVDDLDCSKATSATSSMFERCYNLRKVKNINLSNTASVSNLFNYCYGLISIENVNLSGSTSVTLGSMHAVDYIDDLTINTSFSLSNSKALTRESLVRILNDLPTVTETQTLTLGSTLLAKLTDEDKLIATEKGWTLA